MMMVRKRIANSKLTHFFVNFDVSSLQAFREGSGDSPQFSAFL